MNRMYRNIVIRNLAFIILIGFLMFSFMNSLGRRPMDPDPFNGNYNAFITALRQGRVASITSMVQKSDVKEIRGTMDNGVAFELMGPPFDETLTALLIEKNIPFYQKAVPQNLFLNLFMSVVPMILLIVLMFFMLQQTQSGGKAMQFGKSRAKLQSFEKKKVTFDDVAGIDEVKEELQEVVDFLKNPDKFIAIGAKIPKGILLVGLPGTGKTLIARALAGEAGVPFFSISGSDFVEMFVGVGASRVRDLFDQAKKNCPCIVFIDEIDAVGRQRGAGLGGGHDEREQTLNQLLVEMDGFTVNESIIIIAATNRPDILDPALLRPGRFDRQVVVDAPDLDGREAILKVHSKGKPLEDKADLTVLAKRTPGFTGADLANLMNEAALLTARRNKKKISMIELEEAIERTIAGPEKKSRKITVYDQRLVAYHESGHTLVAARLAHTDPIHKVSIVPRGRAGGYTLMLPDRDTKYIPKGKLVDEVKTLLGGRIAESLVLEEISTGATNDLERASKIIRRMITEYGMSEALGPLTYGAKQEQVFLGRDFAQNRDYSESVAEAIDKEARLLMNECYHDAETILQENIDVLHTLAKALMERETLNAEEVNAIFEAAGLNKPEPHWGALEKKWADEDEVAKDTQSEGKAEDFAAAAGRGGAMPAGADS
ncbi:MAG: ATP-dependent zinc metalloprotease FtsH [Clostridiales bacterium]|nr:ATP-dependent zinc metalloprotease FtsH [Clostridiales bacterium]